MKSTLRFVLIGGFAFVLAMLGLTRFPGRDRAPFEKTLAGKIATEMTQFAKRNNGTWPNTWLQLTNLAEHNGYLLQRKGLLIPEAYTFTPTNLVVTGYYEGSIVIMRNKLVKEHGRNGRYFVYYDRSEAEFREGWMSEEDAQALIAKFGVTLPEPNPEEVRAARESVRSR